MRAQFTVLSTLFASVAIIAWTPPAPAQQNGTLPVTAKPGEWRYLNADPLSTRYSLLDQITKDISRIEDRLAVETCDWPGAVISRRHRAE